MHTTDNLLLDLIGGSMSTMFAARAATFGQFGKVTNVSFASPYCGDQGFRDHFYELEQKNLIRHIRFSNEEDVVPLIPFVAPNGLAPVEMYKHVSCEMMTFHVYSLFSCIYKSCVHPSSCLLTMILSHHLLHFLSTDRYEHPHVQRLSTPLPQMPSILPQNGILVQRSS